MDKCCLILGGNSQDGSYLAEHLISTWINEKLNLQFTGSAVSLKKAFQEYNLCTTCLSYVRTGKRVHHKNWRVLLF